MFYIVETEEQLNKVISYGGNEKVFIEIIPIDDRIHPCINTASLVYFRPLSAKRGFIIAISHLETFSLPYDLVLSSLINEIPQIYTIDKKTLLHYGVEPDRVKGLKMAYTLTSNYPDFPDSSKYDTSAHKFYNTKLRNRTDVNKFIPVSKHYEKYEDLFESLIIEEADHETADYIFYNDLATKAFYGVESSGIGINPGQFDLSFNRFHKEYSIKDDTIYSQYNLYNHTARPSCMYNNLNFLGLKKDNDSRKSLVPRNDIFVEFDYKSFQIKLLANLIGYHFEEDNIHDHLAKLYGIEDYAKAKKLTFRYLYGRDPEAPDIPFFKEVYALRDFLWEQYLEQDYIESPVTGRKIRGIDEITQILPYLMQCIETESNVFVMLDIQEILNEYKSKLVLYTYDAFLFDLFLDEAPQLIPLIQHALESANCKFTMSYGDSYGELIQSQ